MTGTQGGQQKSGWMTTRNSISTQGEGLVLASLASMSLIFDTLL